MKGFILLFLVFHFLNGDFFDDQIENLSEASCPFVGIHKSQTCPGSHSFSKTEIISTELITFDAVSRTVRFPIIDLAGSKVKTTDFGKNMAQKSYYYYFTTTKQYYDNFVSFNSSMPFRNGMFQKPLDCLTFFNNYFGNQQNSYLSTMQNEYTTKRMEIPQGTTPVLKKQVQALIDKFLPEKYEENSYAKFVKNFGTQYSTKCSYGGMNELEVFVKKCLYDETPVNSIQEGLRNDMDRTVNGSSTERKGDKNYIHKTKVKVTNSYGGDVLIEKFVDRIPTFPTNPIVTSCDFRPIYELVGGVKGENLKKYIAGYIAGGVKEREEEYEKVKAKKKAFDDAQPRPMVLISDRSLYFYPIQLKKNETSEEYQFHYGKAKRTFLCDCNMDKMCRCYEKGNVTTVYQEKGKQFIGEKMYRWKTCHRTVGIKHCKHHTQKSIARAIINVEIVIVKNDTLVPSCNDF